MKKRIYVILLLIFFQNTINAQKYYTIEQIKDTLIRYKNPFEAFDKLDLYKIPIDKFRKDSFLVSKAIDLFNVNYYNQWNYNSFKLKELKWLEKADRKKTLVYRYLKNRKKIPYKKIEYFYDSIP